MTIEKGQEKLNEIKLKIKSAYDNFTYNYSRYSDFRRFVYISNIDKDEASVLRTLQRPELECNVLESYISKLIGEFSKQVPSIKISPKAGKKVDPKVIEVLDGHIRHILDEANKKGMEVECYKDTLSGGFSAVKVYTEYSSPMSFDQVIRAERVYDPTLVGFDPLTRDACKQDAEFCFELFPKRKEDLEMEYPDEDWDSVRTNYSFGEFSWSFEAMNTDENVMLIADFYEKRQVKKRIVRLADGKVMTTDDYKKLIALYEEEGRIEQPPIIVGKPRWTMVPKIVRYKLVENKILEAEETYYPSLPLIFIDGNSILHKESNQGAVTQFTRPYIYQAKGAQKMKNYAAQCLVNWLENMSMAQWTVPKNSIPKGYEEPWKNPQMANVLVYNAYKDDDASSPLPPPQQVSPRPAPPEIANTLQGADMIMQSILGSFDASLAKLNESQASGIAIQETITLSNSAAMPYVINFLRGIQAIAQKILELIPVIYVTPVTIPVMDEQGHRAHVDINMSGNGPEFRLDYDPDDLQVSVEPGVSFGIQKAKALNQIIALMQASPLFAQFINEVGLEIILDNVEIRNIDSLKQMCDQWMQQKNMEKQQMAQMSAQNPPPEVIMAKAAQQQAQADYEVGMANVKQKEQEHRLDASVKLAELQIDKQEMDIKLMEALAKIEEARAKTMLQENKQASDGLIKVAELSLKEREAESKRSEERLDVLSRNIQESS